jgi:LysM repeat protein
MERNSDYEEHELIDELDENLDSIKIDDDYLTRRKFTSRSTFQDQPLIWGGIGIVFLISLFTLFFGKGDGSINEELRLFNERFENIEQQILSLESTPPAGQNLETHMERLQKSFSGLDRSVKALKARVDNLGQKVKGIEKELGAAKSTIKRQTTKSSQTKPAVNISKHVVKSGDTLYSISKKYSTTVDELRRLNNLTKDQEIFPGQEFVVPTTGGQ